MVSFINHPHGAFAQFALDFVFTDSVVNGGDGCLAGRGICLGGTTVIGDSTIRDGAVRFQVGLGPVRIVGQGVVGVAIFH